MNGFTNWIFNGQGHQPARDRATHTYVIGQPGTGKSRALESWIMQDITSGHGVGVIDPHGDLFRNLIIRLSFMPEVWDRIIIIDPCNPDWATTFNPLDADSNISQERLSMFLTDIISKIWGLDSVSAPRTMWLLKNAFLALTNLKLTLLHLPIFLLDQSYRETLLPRLTNPSAASFFHYEYPKNQSATHQWAAPLLNKIGNLLFDPDISLIFTGKQKISFREILDRQLILLVNLPKGIIGEGVSALMGAFIVAQIQKAAYSRADSFQRKSFYLYLDEFQNYTTDNIKDILSESRKYALSMTLVHQYLDQLLPDIRNALLNTAGAIACFRVGYQDGFHLAKEIFPNQDYLKIEPPFKMTPFLTSNMIGLIYPDNPSGWDGLASSLARLRFREFWFKKRGVQQPSKQRTWDMPLPYLSREVNDKIQDLVSTSGRLYSWPKYILKKEVDFFHFNAIKGEFNNISDEEIREDEKNPLWGV